MTAMEGGSTGFAGENRPAPVPGQLPGSIGQSRVHDSAHLHVTGQARYVDDLPQPANLLHAAVGCSSIACGRITALNLDAVRQADAVVAVVTDQNIPGRLDIGPVFPGDPLLTSDAVDFHGQAIFAVAATNELAARQAVRKASIEYLTQNPVLTIDQAMATQDFVRPPHFQQTGDPQTTIHQAPNQLAGQLIIGGQEHFYMEGQVSLALPVEGGGLLIQTSSQHPSEVQKLVAQVLDIPCNQVTVEVRRMGGAFGGKETQAAQWACLAAVLAIQTARPVKLRLPRMDDMKMTGKRHDFQGQYQVGFDTHGQLLAADINVSARCGYSPDLSDAIVDRAMFHADNAYFLPTARIAGYRCRSNTASNTAFRGFGGPQGMLVIEAAMDDIARQLGKDPLDIRKTNLYQAGGRDTTHYGQKIEQHVLPDLVEELEQSSDYRLRRQQIVAFNRQSPVLKKGLALTPVKFGISFTVPHLNQAGALLHIYTDGSILLNHGGTEMGQGLFTKVAQVVAEVFQVDPDTVQVSATRTDKVPNTSPTAASSGSDLNGQAAFAAATTLRRRLIDFLVQHHQATAENVIFSQDHVRFNDQDWSFAELVNAAYLARVSLSTTGFYKTPKVYYDRDQGQGRPFYYFAHGAAVSEVVIDTLTGEYRVKRVDILHDVGHSLNPAIDIGQIEGGFIQGMGWLTTEELCWNDEGRLLSNNPATYKIPTIGDTPADFRVRLLEHTDNPEDSIYHSKAVGEPPLMLAISVWSALRDAISSISDYRISPQLDTPATPERVLWAVETLQS